MKFDFLNVKSGLLAVAAAGVLASCVVVEEGPRPLPPRPGPGPGPEFCTREFAPVCGEDRGDLQTFPNACEARADGYRIAYPGECRRGPGRPDFGRPDRPQFCTREYDPVCAVRGNRQQTFGNACEAESAGWRIRRGGEC